MSDTTVPGLKAQHNWITPACRAGRGNMEAFEEAVRRTREMYERMSGSAANEAANFHLVLTVDRPPKES